MDSQTLLLVRELIQCLQSGPFDDEGLQKIKEQLEYQRPQLVSVGEQETLSDIIDLLDGWAESTKDSRLASQAIYEAGHIAEHDLKNPERASQLYSLSLELYPANLDALTQLIPLLQVQGHYHRLEVILSNQARALAKMEGIEPQLRSYVSLHLGRLRAEQLNSIDRAIEAYEDALDAEPDLNAIIELADLYAERGHAGDNQQAADLYYTVGDILGNPQGIDMLEKALDQMPTHEQALALLETYLPQEEKMSRLRIRYESFIDQAPNDPGSDLRRLSLCQAYLSEERYQDAYRCIAPLAAKGDIAAGYIIEDIKDKIGIATEDANPTGLHEGNSDKNASQTLPGLQVPAEIQQTMSTDEPAQMVRPIEQIGSKIPASTQAQMAFSVEQVEQVERLEQPVSFMPVTDIPVSSRYTLATLREIILHLPRVQVLIGLGALLLVVSGVYVFAADSDNPAGEDGTADKHQKTTQLISDEEKKQDSQPNVINKRKETNKELQSKPQEAKKATKKTRAKKKQGSVLLVTRAAKYRGGRINKKKSLQALRKSLPKMELCYEKAIRRKKKLKGWMVFTWTVKRNGRVAAAKKIRGSIKDRPLSQCMSSVIRKVRFPKPRRRAARIRFPVKFRSAG